MRIRSLTIAVAVLGFAGAAIAMPQPPAEGAPGGQIPPATQEKDKKPVPDPLPVYEEQVVVTASKIEQKLINAPAPARCSRSAPHTPGRSTIAGRSSCRQAQ